MSSYRDFVQKARARFTEGKSPFGGTVFTRHAEFKMRQYRLSEQKVRGVIRNPRRREEGIMKDTVAVMQPVSPKRDTKGGETWNQEIWVMYQTKKQDTRNKVQKFEALSQNYKPEAKNLRVISAWRYPGVSPKGNPVPEEILREIEERSILEEGININE